MPRTWTFHSAGSIIFGDGAIAQLEGAVRRLKVSRLLVVTDRRLAEAGIVELVTAALARSSCDVEVFDGGEPEPSLRLADTLVEAACHWRPDGIVGLGGGSNMDLAKIAAAILAHGGSPRDLVGEDRVPGPVLPLICIPTTAGTGSEASASAIVTDEENEIKLGILSNYLRPAVAVIDPRLTMTCPRKVTADSGIDALTHAIEALTAVDNEQFPLPAGQTSMYQGRHPFADAIAEKAIELIGANLQRAVTTPGDYAAREAMSLGALLGGLAFSNVGVALVHALEYPLGAATHCSHGEGNGLLLPHVMRFNLPARRRAFARVAQLLGKSTAGLGEEEAALQAVVAVEELTRAIGIPLRMRDLGARRDQLGTFADKALSIERMLRVNPRPVTRDDALAILEAAY